VFTEGGETALTARDGRNGAPRRAWARDASEAARRKQEALAIAGAAAFAALIILLLAPRGRIDAGSTDSLAAPGSGWLTEAARSAGGPVALGDELAGRASPGSPVPAGAVPSRPAGPVLKAAAQLCTDFGRVSDLDELRARWWRRGRSHDASGLSCGWAMPPAAICVP
jgi:hypothetical protein